MSKNATAKALWGVALLVAFALLGSLIYFDTLRVWNAPRDELINLAVVAAIVSWTLMRAATARGSGIDKLQQVIITGTVLFGTYALVVLMGRYFFSRSLLIVVIPATALLSLAIIWVRNRSLGIKVAIIKPLTKRVPAEVRKVATVVEDPAVDFRAFDIVLVDLDVPVSADWAKALSRAMMAGCRVRHIEDHAEELRGGVDIKVFELEHLPATEQDSYIAIKRMIDIASVIVLAPIAIPLVLISAVVILVTSGWPIFFLGRRVGLGGETFVMWKLRTMRNLKIGENHTEAVKGDKRVTTIGRLLRRSRIDELPQLWNVLKGEMSLIGPRPEAEAFHEAYTQAYPEFAYRCLVRPGITGWAQVNAPPSASADEAMAKLAYDLYYVKRQSLAIDVQIALRTLWTITHGSGVR